MSRKARLVIMLLVVELLLAGGWLYLAQFGRNNPDRVTADFQRTVGETMGGAMGVLLGLGLVMFFVAARNDAKKQ